MKLDWRIVLAVVLAWYSLGSVDGCKLPDVLPIPSPVVEKPVLSELWVVAEDGVENSIVQAEIITSDWYGDLRAKGVKAGTLYTSQPNDITKQAAGLELPAVVLLTPSDQQDKGRVIEKWSIGDSDLDQLEAKIAEVARYAN